MKYTSIDLFSGAGGITLGLKDANFQTLLASDYDERVAETFNKNFQNTKFICDDIKNLKFQDIKKEIGLKNNELDLIVGGPPCQGFQWQIEKGLKMIPEIYCSIILQNRLMSLSLNVS